MMIELYGIKTKDRYFLGQIKTGYSHDSDIKSFVFDGKPCRPTFDSLWVELDAKPSTIERHIQNPAINHRFELKDQTMASEKFPLVLKRSDVCVLVNYSWEWTEPFEHLQSLYSYKEDKQPDSLAPVEFKIVSEVSFESFKDIGGFSYPVEPETHLYGDKEGKPITEKEAQSQLLDKILFPKIILSQMPCALTSKQVYRIVRKHVKANINPQAAKISSDYDFCFTVEKVIALSKEEVYSVDANLNPFSQRKRKPRMEKRYRKDRTVKVFEMTHSEENYRGYTPIAPMIAENADALKEKMDSFLDGLMKEINEPLSDCPNCEGTGVLLKSPAGGMG